MTKRNRDKKRQLRNLKDATISITASVALFSYVSFQARANNPDPYAYTYIDYEHSIERDDLGFITFNGGQNDLDYIEETIDQPLLSEEDTDLPDSEIEDETITNIDDEPSTPNVRESEGEESQTETNEGSTRRNKGSNTLDSDSEESREPVEREQRKPDSSSEEDERESDDNNSSDTEKTPDTSEDDEESNQTEDDQLEPDEVEDENQTNLNEENVDLDKQNKKDLSTTRERKINN